jgi:hypothetical protein
MERKNALPTVSAKELVRDWCYVQVYLAEEQATLSIDLELPENAKYWTKLAEEFRAIAEGL